MKRQIIQYTGLILSTAFAFGNFVACGSKMYQVSMEGDTTRRQLGDNGKPLSNDNKSLLSQEIYPGIHAPGGWPSLPIPYQFSADLDEKQKDGLIKAMETWEVAVGKKLFAYSGKDPKKGDQFNDLFSSLNDAVNGHYQDFDWKKTGKSEMVLATTIWDNVPGDEYSIKTADIRFNSENYIIGDSYLLSATADREVVDMESLALHELGHLLGLSHVDHEADSLSIMNPSLFIGEGLSNRKISKGDIERIQRIYGCDADACDVDALYTKLESAGSDEPADIEAH